MNFDKKINAMYREFMASKTFKEVAPGEADKNANSQHHSVLPGDALFSVPRARKEIHAKTSAPDFMKKMRKDAK